MEQKKHNQKYRVGIVTLSDKGFKGEREDLSGPKIKSLLLQKSMKWYHIAFYRMTKKQ